MTTVAQIIDAFQQVNGGVAGIAFAPKSNGIPAQLSASQLPAVVTWYANDDWTKFGNMLFAVEVYIAPTGTGNPTTAMQTALALVDRFRAAYRLLHHIGSVPIAREKGPHGFGANGVHKTLGFGGIEYFGFSLRVPLMGE